jgi:hypothetical protein
MGNRIIVDGGEISGTGFGNSLVGNVIVHGASRIQALDVLGDVLLTDQSQLKTVDHHPVVFAGEVRVGGEAELAIGRTSVRTSAGGVDEGTVHIAGTVASHAARSVLNITSQGLDDLILDESIRVGKDQSLEIRKDGNPFQLTISGAGKSVSGGGTLVNEVLLADSARVSPGESVGTLFGEGAWSLGAGAVYEWNVRNATGTAGSPSGWDLLRIAGTVDLAATEESPIVIEVAGLDESNQSGTVADFDPRQGYMWTILSSEQILGFDPSRFSIDADMFFQDNPRVGGSRLNVLREGKELVLIYTVPEPSAWMLAGIGVVLVATRRLRPC